MRVLHYNNIDFSIDKDGNISRQSIWHVTTDAGVDIDAEWINFQAAVETWAGNIGDAWRKPTADSQGYTLDADYIVTNISFDSTARYMYEITFTGVKKHATAEIIGGMSETINSNGEKEKSGTWVINDSVIDDWTPEIGTVVVWAGAAFLCYDVQKQELGYGEWEVTIRAKDMSILMLGNPSYSCNTMMEKTKTSRWLVNNAEYGEFMATHDINSDASGWAGEGYYITNVDSEGNGKLGYIVTLEAKHISVRQIELQRREQLAGFDNRGNMKVNISYTGRWQVHKDSIEDFQGRIGGDASEWAQDGFIVYDVDPVQVSDVEYEVSMEAKDPTSDTQGIADASTLDDKSDLASRDEAVPVVTEMKLSMRECGWKHSKDTPTEITEIYKEATWNYTKECPFIRDSKEDVLPEGTWNKNIRLSGLRRTYFLRNDPKLYVADVNDIKFFNGKLAGTNITGSWRSGTPQVSADTNNEGELWTRVTIDWWMAPDGQIWNPSYFTV